MRQRTIWLALLFAVLATSLSSAQDCEEAVSFETHPGSISMHHNEALFNCCAWLDVVAAVDSWEIEFTEWEMFEDGPCYCLCCFEAEASLSGLEPGLYTARVRKALNNFDGTWTFVTVAEEPVSVEGESVPGFYAHYVPCVESELKESESVTWGTIKALYRCPDDR